jgi:hypothetical protein
MHSAQWGSDSKRRQQPVETYLLQDAGNFAEISQDNPEAVHSCDYCGRLVIDMEIALANQLDNLWRIPGTYTKGVWLDFDLSLKDLEDAKNNG